MTIKTTAEKENDARKENKNLIVERDEAIKKAKQAEESAKIAYMTAFRENNAEITELRNQIRVMKKALGISEEAKYDEVRRQLKDLGLLHKEHENYYR